MPIHNHNPSQSMPKRVLLISYDLTVDELPRMDTTNYLKRLGENSGNLAFAYATQSHIINPITYWSESGPPPERLKEHFDIIVFTAANNLATDQDLGWLADLAERSGLPMTVVGLGAQAGLDDTSVELPPGTERFIAVVKEQKIKLGVRGEFTRQLLLSKGVTTAEVIGCPSHFINPDPNLGKRIAAAFAQMPTKPCFALNLEYFRLESEKIHVLTKLLRQNGGWMALQSDLRLIRALRNDGTLDTRIMTWFGEYFLGHRDPIALKRFISQYGRSFIHVPSWLEALRAVDLSIGTRFHGNMLAIQAGRPAIVFTHDSRTKELCDVTMLPQFPWTNVGPDFDMDKLSSVAFDPVAFDAQRIRLAGVYRDILLAAGLTPSKTLNDLAAAQA